MTETNRRTILRLGWLLVLVGAVFNEWFVAGFFSPDGVISSVRLKFAIRLFEILSVSGGLFLVSRWRSVKAGPTAVKAALYVVSAVVLLVSSDLLLRLIEKSAGHIHHIEDLEAWMENPRGTGSYRAKPNLDLVYRFGPSDRVSVGIRTNSFGMRWREVSLDKPDGKERIAFAGDGLTEGASSARMEESAKRYEKFEP